MNVGLALRNIRCLTQYQLAIFVGTGGGVFISTNNGGNWSSLNFGTSTTCFASTDELLFAGSSYGEIYHSSDRGATWRESRNQSIGQVNALVAKGQMLFAGTTENGIWRRPISEFTQIDVPQKRMPKPGTEFVIHGRRGGGQYKNTELTIPGPERVCIEIFNMAGKRVAVPVNGFYAAGTHSFLLKTSLLTAGYYVARMRTKHSVLVRNLVVLH